ncbi:UDP-N-acetylglucosamine diphosphorylase [Candidatus Bipolaricaulota bacterium]|nr:UDP-N-acetylglucosamine diphosphorylase [Candidatus Bipolaricaulota bacterium]
MSGEVPGIGKFFDLEKTDYEGYYTALEFPWDVLGQIPQIIEDELDPGIRGEVSGSAELGERVEVGSGTVVEAGATIKGPAIIGSDCEIRSGAYIRSDVVVGDGVTVGNSTELKRSLIHDEAEIPHFSYVGDSVIGWKGHLGAGVKVSNLKVNREPVVVHLENDDIDTGLRKFGCLLGDRAEIGCNSVLNPGTLVGRRTLATSNTSLSGYYPPERFIKLNQKIEETERR